MKKLSFFLLSLLAVTLFTSCNKEDETVSKQSYTSTINCRAIDGENVVFSQNTAKVELNYTDLTIQFTVDYRDASGAIHNLTTPAMKMTQKSGMIYSFNHAGGAQQAGSLEGYINLSTGLMWYTLNNGDQQIVSTTHLLYSFVPTTVTNPDNGYSYNHQQSEYLFAPDAKGETCVMSISNFIPNIAGTVEVSKIDYSGLKLTPTATGYVITASEVEPTNFHGNYVISDLNITLDSQCRLIDGSFKCKDLEFKIAGNLL